ncbi:trypsin-like serine peptidase [Sneathiella glossodoripedis]|uniref:trypsin-like serine peptidase n=1 Tax=Sneathiella glossodoripedis TaxID=418853 RepID=UPI00046E6A11|nr:trypsin-like serine protease [Sneathiella glossodoripedis]
MFGSNWKRVTRLTVTAFFVLASATAVATASPQDNSVKRGIKGVDDRSRIDITAYPWRAIGRVNNDGRFCTGVLVGENKVLTAAHCLWNNRTNRWSKARFFHFVLGYEKGEYAAHAKGLAYLTAHGRNPKTPFPEFERSEDWAILTIDKPLGKEFGVIPVVSGLGVRTDLARDRKSQIFQAGYSGDFAHVLTVHKNCEITAQVRLGSSRDPLYTHQCDATRGDSGSPLFLRKGRQFGLVAIHSTTNRMINGKAIGVAIPSELFEKAVKAVF